MSRVRPVLLRACALAATLSAAACVDEVPTLTTPGTFPGWSLSTGTAAPAADPQHAALDQLTRAVALALRDEGLRQRVKNDLRNSAFQWEHKLEFRSYLQGGSGGILLAKMAKETGSSREAVLALLGQVRPLEFYMPVAGHRETWRGGSDLLVASQIEDFSVPAAYTLSGQPVALSPYRAPSTPVLVLTPVETDFSRPLDQSRFRNRNDQGGQTIGTYEIEAPCNDCGGEGGSGGVESVTPGLYMTVSHIPDTREGWAKGAPEIEYHIQGPNFQHQQNSVDLACSGESANGSRNFNQDHPDYTGRVLLFTKAQMDQQRNEVGDSKFHVTVWEDDDTRCSIKTDNQTDNLFAIGNQLGYNATMAAAAVCPTCAAVLAPIQLGLAIYYTALTIQGNDDYIGLVEVKGSDPRYSHVPTNRVILKSNADDITGWAQIVMY